MNNKRIVGSLEVCLLKCVCWNVKWVKDIRFCSASRCLVGWSGLLDLSWPKPMGDPWWRSVIRVACLDLLCVPAYDILGLQIPTNKKIDRQVDWYLVSHQWMNPLIPYSVATYLIMNHHAHLRMVWQHSPATSEPSNKSHRWLIDG